MKTLALAALVATGFALTAGTADAQYRYRNSGSYSTYRGSALYSNPGTIYSYPSTTYSSFAPAYVYPDSGVVTSYYSPYSGSVVTPAGFTPAYNYNYPSYSYTSPSYYGTYGSGTYYTPSGGVIRGFRR